MRAYVLVPLLLLPLPEAVGAVQGGAAASRLFESHDLLRVRIEADFDALEGDRDQESEYREGRFFLVAPDGTETALPLEVKTRGNFRLRRSTCRFPPLRLNFPKGDLGGTILEGEDKLKLVTHCRDRDRFEQIAVKEYLIYRTYNLLTDASFRVRLARIVYEDTGGEHDPVERWGFLIEEDDLLAERLGGVLLDDEGMRLHPARITGAHEGRVALFQYMVGNTDFSIFYGHNVKIVEDPEGSLIPVPYDFDWSGLVNAPYAEPPPQVETQHVRERVYRGLCRTDVDFPALYAAFLEKRVEVEALFRSEPALEEDEREKALEYLEDFFETIADRESARRRIERACTRV